MEFTEAERIHILEIAGRELAIQVQELRAILVRRDEELAEKNAILEAFKTVKDFIKEE